MWQSIVVLMVIAVVSIYVARHFFRVFRGSKSHCGCCSECQGLSTPASGNAQDCSPQPGLDDPAARPSHPDSCCGDQS